MHATRRGSRLGHLFVLSTVLATALMAIPARAAEKLGNSLDFVPADASFYSTSLRLREQFDRLLGSKAWAKLLQMQSVQMALNMARSQLEQPGGPKEQWENFIRNPDNERLVETLKDMASTEVFVYGDKRFADFLGLSIEAFNAARYAPALSRLVDPSGAQNDERVAMSAFLETLNDNLDRVVVPDLVIGFKISDTNRADQQVRRLETLVNVVIGLLTINEFKDRFGRVKVGDGEFIEMRLDGKLVPWEEFPFADFEENPGDFEPLKQKLRSLTMTIDLGIKDGYLLFSIGDTNEHVATLGKTDLLINRPELKPLGEHVSKRLVEIGFTSKEFNSLITGTKDDVDGLVELAEEMLPYAELPDELEKRILEDARALATDLKPFVPEPGGSLSFSYLTPQGYEGFAYDWTQNLTLDDSKPLSLARHTGGSPLLAWVARNKQSPQDYDLLVKWIKKGYGYFEEFGLPQMSDAEREQVQTGHGLRCAAAQANGPRYADHADPRLGRRSNRIGARRRHHQQAMAQGDATGCRTLADARVGARLRRERCGAIEERHERILIGGAGCRRQAQGSEPRLAPTGLSCARS